MNNSGAKRTEEKEPPSNTEGHETQSKYEREGTNESAGLSFPPMCSTKLKSVNTAYVHSPPQVYDILLHLFLPPLPLASCGQMARTGASRLPTAVMDSWRLRMSSRTTGEDETTNHDRCVSKCVSRLSRWFCWAILLALPFQTLGSPGKSTHELCCSCFVSAPQIHHSWVMGCSDRLQRLQR